MKKLIPLLLALTLLFALLTGCGANSTTEMSLMNTDLTIEFETSRRGTVTTAGGDIYEFHLGSDDICEITYPNGKTYSNEKRVIDHNSYSSSDSDGISVGFIPVTEHVNAYEGDEYLPTASLADAIALAQPSGVPVLGILFAFGLIIAGIAIIVKSHALMEGVLYIRNQHKDPNHREMEHANILISGVITAAVGLIVLIVTMLSAV